MARKHFLECLERALEGVDWIIGKKVSFSSFHAAKYGEFTFLIRKAVNCERQDLSLLY